MADISNQWPLTSDDNELHVNKSIGLIPSSSSSDPLAEHDYNSGLTLSVIDPRLRSSSDSDASSHLQSTEHSPRDPNSLSPSNSDDCSKSQSSPASSCSNSSGGQLSSSPRSFTEYHHVFPANPTKIPKRKRRQVTEEQKAKRNKLRNEGACVPCRLSHNSVRV